MDYEGRRGRKNQAPLQKGSTQQKNPRKDNNPISNIIPHLPAQAPLEPFVGGKKKRYNDTMKGFLAPCSFEKKKKARSRGEKKTSRAIEGGGKTHCHTAT